MRRLTGLIASVTLIGCSDGRYMRVGIEPLSSSGIPSFQQVDDSVRLFATEWRHGLLGADEPAIASSDAEPASYRWTTNNPAVVDVRQSGWMVTHATGEAIITVTGPASSYSQNVLVCPRGTVLRIEPHDPTIALHDTIIVSVSLVQAGGAECSRLDFGPFMPQQGSGRAGLEPIFSLPNHWRSIQAGSYWYTSSVQFAQRTLRDSVLVTIR